MDLLRQDIKSLYFKYLSAAFGSAMISSIYAIVDMAMVGQYQGPDGTAALAVVAPIWNLIYSLGLLTGIGGSVLFSTLKGQQQKGGNSENEYFTASLTGTAAFALISWLLILFLDAPLLRLFGADEALLPLAQEYLLPIKFVIPFFVFNQMLAAFLRNDRNPGLATAAVLSGGILNIIGDYLFVFPLGMGIMGAGLATALGAALTFIVLLSHFFTSRNSLRIVKVSAFPQKLNRILFKLTTADAHVFVPLFGEILHFKIINDRRLFGLNLCFPVVGLRYPDIGVTLFPRIGKIFTLQRLSNIERIGLRFLNGNTVRLLL